MPDIAPSFTLPNVGAGPNPCSLEHLRESFELAVLCFQRDYYCTRCRDQVTDLDANLDRFHDLEAEVVSLVPESTEKLQGWQNSYDLQYPLLADADAAISEAYGQRVRFGILGQFSDFLGRMPKIVIVDLDAADPTIEYVYQGSSTFDRPATEALLSTVSSLRHGASVL